MSRIDSIKQQVALFHAEHAAGTIAADAFAPWWLWRKHEVPQGDAVRRCPGGSDDYGLDGFHLDVRASDVPVLRLVQAKFTDSFPQIRRGVQDFARAMPQLAAILSGREVAGPRINPLYAQLAAALAPFVNGEKRGNEHLRLEFEVLHLSADPVESLARRIEPAFTEFKDAAERHFPDHVCLIRLIDLETELREESVSVVTPAARHGIRFDGRKISDEGEATFYAGFGFLADLVDLYRLQGDALFSRNVRSFLYRASEKGPAKYMRESIRESCIPNNAGKYRASPERFALLHNGITISARSASLEQDRIELREPSVINGCQTVKNAALFSQEPNVRDRIVGDRFRAIRIPVRILVTRDEDLLRDVTISNNRQNSIRPSAFRSNDKVQITLANRFAESGIFYERQEQAFANMSRSNAKELQESFANSDAPLTMEHLAQAIALVSNSPALSTASKVSDVFEEAVYKNLFTADRIKHLELLVFLRNLLVAAPLVIRDVMGSAKKFDTAPSKKKFAYPAVRILARYVVEEEHSLVREYGRSVIRQVGPTHPFRRRLVQLCHSANSGLQQRLKEHWYDAGEDVWLNPLDADICKSVLGLLDLHGTDVFKRWDEIKSLENS
jgi:hypothetical protein